MAQHQPVPEKKSYFSTGSSSYNDKIDRLQSMFESKKFIAQPGKSPNYRNEDLELDQ